MADLNVSIESVTGKEADMRAAFKKKFADNISSGVYDQRDLDRLEQDDAYARCYLRTLLSNGDPQKSADVLDTAFKYRKEIGIWDLTEDSFSEELRAKNIYYKGTTKDGFKLLYIENKGNTTKTKEEETTLRKYIAYMMEQHHGKTPEEFCVVLLDMHGCSTGNANTEFTKFLITCFSTYFASFQAYMINYDMPMLLSAAWKVVSAFMTKQQKGKVSMCGKKDIGKHLDDELRKNWPHMV